MSERKVCVVSGSSSGIGAATVKRFAREGWDVVVNFSRSREPAEAVAAECRALGRERGGAQGVQALVLQADIADDAQCRAMAQQVQQQLGRCDVLVNNAGTTKFVPMKQLDGLQAQDFHDIYAVNVVGTYQLTRAFVPLLEQQRGAGVVNISSVASMMGRGSSIAYMASKGAVNAMTVGLARALSPKIRVNAIAPGLVDTPWLRQGLGERYPKYVKDWTDRAALEDVIQPEDVAGAAWWLGAGAAKTTGEVLLLDAGFRLTKA
jgi:3-oxoacyl-[acyl-carrier protein] reductase